eukprot:1141831-Amphidinium_carterae.1
MDIAFAVVFLQHPSGIPLVRTTISRLNNGGPRATSAALTMHTQGGYPQFFCRQRAYSRNDIHPDARTCAEGIRSAFQPQS